MGIDVNNSLYTTLTLLNLTIRVYK